MRLLSISILASTACFAYIGDTPDGYANCRQTGRRLVFCLFEADLLILNILLLKFLQKNSKGILFKQTGCSEHRIEFFHLAKKGFFRDGS